LDTKINIGNLKMPFMKKIFLSLAAVTATLSSFAHEGHGHTHGFTIQHYFVEPEHVLVVLAVAATGVLLFRRYRPAADKK
jgi:hydrogenase/urease accessory protein HupE